MSGKVATNIYITLAQNVNMTGVQKGYSVLGASVGHLQVSGLGTVALQGSLDGNEYYSLPLTLMDGTQANTLSTPGMARVQLFGLVYVRLQIVTLTSPITAYLSALS